ncbi:hypothetical protein ACLKA6_013892 [Drosophila palustris]
MSDLMAVLQNVATKTDIEELKEQLGGVSEKIEALQAENQELKTEIEKLKSDRNTDRKELNRLIELSRSKNIIVKGLRKNEATKEGVKQLLRDKLEIAKAEVCSTRILYERQNNVGVIAELESATMVSECLRNGRKLAGSKIFVEKDLSIEKQEHKIVLLQLKRHLATIDTSLRVLHKEGSPEGVQAEVSFSEYAKQ